MHWKSLKKLVSLITIATFLCTNTVYAAPSSRSLFKNKKVDYKKLSTQSEQRLQKKKAIFRDGDDRTQQRRKQAKRVLQTHLKDLSQIHIPSEYGRVIEVYDASKDEGRTTDHEPRLIVHIQDLHTNPEAQFNLASILELLIRDYKLDLVCSEGADGIIDTSSISSFPNYEIREKTARIFVNTGELTGEEFLSITKYPELAIWGIEDRDIYFENIVQFNKVMRYNPQSQVFISQVKKAMESLKPKIYSKELKIIDQKEADYENEKIETEEYLKHLTGYIQKFNIPTSSYKNISLLNETIEQEKNISQAEILKESQNLLINLHAAIAKKSLRNEMDSLMVKAQLFKEQKISPFSFYSYLKDLALEHLHDKRDSYQNINEFIDYLTKVNSLDTTKLFVEMEGLTFDVKQRLAKTPEQKKLVQVSRNIKFLEGFFNLKVSNEELDYYLANKDFHKVNFFETFLKPALKKHNITTFIDFNPNLIDIHLDGLEIFYKTVKARDIAMVRNSLSEIENRNAKVSALISGGFHTKGITRLLRDKGYSYIVVSPYSSTDIDEENYHFLLSGKRKPITELLKQLDLSEIVNNLSASLRIPLGLDKDISLAFNIEKAPVIAEILGVSVDEVKIAPLTTRIAIMLGLQRGAELWASSSVEIEIKSPQKGVIVVKYAPENYIQLTSTEAITATAKQFKGKTVASIVKQVDKPTHLASNEAVRFASKISVGDEGLRTARFAPAVVISGGGSGLNFLNRVFGDTGSKVSKLITPFDTGGSTGKIAKMLKDDMSIPSLAPGDFTKEAIVRSPKERREVLAYRFVNETGAFKDNIGDILSKKVKEAEEDPTSNADTLSFGEFARILINAAKAVDATFPNIVLQGHSVKNLVLLGLIIQEGGYAKNIFNAEGVQKGLEKFLSVAGVKENVVLPTSIDLDNGDLRIAYKRDGVTGQHEITVTRHKEPIKKLYFGKRNTPPEAYKFSLDEINSLQEGDFFILGQGSFYTSILVNLLPKGMTEAIKRARERGVISVFIFNPMYDNETDFMRKKNGINPYIYMYKQIQEHTKSEFAELFDYCIINETAQTPEEVKNAMYVEITEEKAKSGRLLDKQRYGPIGTAKELEEFRDFLNKKEEAPIVISGELVIGIADENLDLGKSVTYDSKRFSVLFELISLDRLLRREKKGDFSKVVLADLHATVDSLIRLKRSNPGLDFWVIGDMIDRGSEFANMIRLVDYFTLGDHDLWFMAAAMGDEYFIAHHLWMIERYPGTERALAERELGGLGIDLGEFKKFAEKQYKEPEMRNLWLYLRIKELKKWVDNGTFFSLFEDANFSKEEEKAIKVLATKYKKLNKAKVESIMGKLNKIEKDKENITDEALQKAFRYKGMKSINEQAIFNIWVKIASKVGVITDEDLERMDPFLRDKFFKGAASEQKLTEEEKVVLEDIKEQFMNSPAVHEWARIFWRGKGWDIISAVPELRASQGQEKEGWIGRLNFQQPGDYRRALVMHAVMPVNKEKEFVDLEGQPIVPENKDKEKIRKYYDEINARLKELATRYEDFLASRINEEGLWKDFEEGSDPRDARKWFRLLADGEFSPLYAREQKRIYNNYIKYTSEPDNVAFTYLGVKKDETIIVSDKEAEEFSKKIRDIFDVDVIINGHISSKGEELIEVFAGGTVIKVDAGSTQKSGGAGALEATERGGGVILEKEKFKEISLLKVRKILDDQTGVKFGEARDNLLSEINLRDIMYYEKAVVLCDDIFKAPMLLRDILYLLRIQDKPIELPGVDVGKSEFDYDEEAWRRIVQSVATGKQNEIIKKIKDKLKMLLESAADINELNADIAKSLEKKVTSKELEGDILINLIFNVKPHRFRLPVITKVIDGKAEPLDYELSGFFDAGEISGDIFDELGALSLSEKASSREGRRNLYNLYRPNLLEGIKTVLPLELDDELVAQSGLLEDWHVFSRETQAFLMLRELAGEKFHKAKSLLYQSSYIRQLLPAEQERLFKELAASEEEVDADWRWLKEHFNQDVEEQVEAMKEHLSKSTKERIIRYTKIRDTVVSHARSLRIGLEVMEQYREDYGKAGIAVNKDVLRKMIEDPALRNVVFGFKAIGKLSGKWSEQEIKFLEEHLWVFAQIEGRIINLLKLPDGTTIAYDEYVLKAETLNKGNAIANTKQGLEHLIKVSLMGRRDELYKLFTAGPSGYFKGWKTIAESILFKAEDKQFSKWDKEEKIWFSAGLGRRVWMLNRYPLDAKVLNTKDRPVPVKDQLRSELANQEMFNQLLPIIVIDDESELGNLEEYKKVMTELKDEFRGPLEFLEGSRKINDVKTYARILAEKYQGVLDDEKKDSRIESILRKQRKDKRTGKKYKSVDDDDNKVNIASLESYIRDNTFYHISGIRNYTILLLYSRGMKTIMNFDDDAPPETYGLLPNDRKTLMDSRLEKKKELMKELMNKVTTILRLRKSIEDEEALYRQWAKNTDKLKDLEEEYFGYSGDGKKGSIPQAMEEIIPLSGPKPVQFAGQGLKVDEGPSQFFDDAIQLTHQRYQGLMISSLPRNNVAISDFVYPEPRMEKKDERFMTIPVNVMRGAELIGKKAGDTHFMYMQGDLRGTMGKPATEKQIQELKKKTITYVPYPFVLDQDTSGLAQFVRYLDMPDKSIINLQHTDRSALIAGNIRGFVSDTYIIFNRSAFDISSPRPTIGQTLRLEEPPYIKWIKGPLSRNEVTVAFSPVAGGQQRAIGDRFYMISFQDFNEMVGTLSKGFYEEAVKAFDDKLKNYTIPQDADSRELHQALGNSYIKVAKGLKISDGDKEELLDTRRYRAVLLSRLAIQRAEKEDELTKTSDSMIKNKLERQINDMDLILIRYADQFHLYRAKNIPDKERTSIEDDHSPSDEGKDYFYRIYRKDDQLHWQKVKPSITLGKREDVTNLVAVKSRWVDMGDRDDVVIPDNWKEGIEFEIGRKVVLEELPQEGKEIIVPALVKEYESEYLEEIQEQLSSQIRQDGESIYMWPDFMEVAEVVAKIKDISEYMNSLPHDKLPEEWEYILEQIQKDPRVGADHLIKIDHLVKQLEILIEHGYYETEYLTNLEFRRKISDGLTPETNNPIKGKVLSPPASGQEGAPVILSGLSKERISELEKKGSGIKASYGFSAGGLSTRSGGLFDAKFSFSIPELDKAKHSFLELKFMRARQAREEMRGHDPDAKLFVLIMASYQTKDIIESTLKENKYFGYPEDEVIIFTQGVQFRIDPSGKPLRKDDGSLVLNPPGHWDFINWMALSGLLARLERDGTEFIFHSNMNNPAARLYDLIKGLFKEQIEKAPTDEKPVGMVLLAENRGEKGGFFVSVKYGDNGDTRLRIVEGYNLPDEAAKEIKEMKEGELAEKYPYFNTASFLFSIEGLMHEFDLPEDYDKTLDFAEIARRVYKNQPEASLSVKETDDRGTKLKGYQIERAIGDFTDIWPSSFVVIDRDEEFIPLKQLEDVDVYNNEKSKKALANLAKTLKADKKDIGPTPIASNATLNLSEFKNEILLFLGDEVEANLDKFNEILKRLDESQIAIVLVKNDAQRRAIEYGFRLEYEELPHDFEVWTLERAGLMEFDFSNVMDEDGYGIKGISHIRFVPLSKVLKYQEISESNVGV